MRIGILGGGQLARMLALAGHPLGLKFIVVDKNPNCCASAVARILPGDINDSAVIDALLEQVDVVTYENENIPLSAAQAITDRIPLLPGCQALQCAQDRWQEKQLFAALKIPTTQFFSVNNRDELLNAAEKLGFPFVLKTQQGGYDGKGQTVIKSKQQLDGFELAPCQYGYLAENFIHFSREVSCIVVRASSGEQRFYDLCENTHKSGILVETHVRSTDPMAGKAQHYVSKIADKLNYIGVLAVEFFEQDGELFANEMAPRVHNTGHWTIEGAVTSQFENHLRAIADLPLGKTTTIIDTAMFNIIGAWPAQRDLLAIDNLHLHDYQKIPRAGRKLGHVTLMPSSEAACASVRAQLNNRRFA